MAEETIVIESLVTPETSFEDYVAQRMDTAHKESFAAEVEPEEIAETSDPGQPTETVESAPATETPAATVPPSEPATAPAIVEETQEQKEQKEQREKNKGIPQSRLDEVTKARREAERALEGEKTAREKAERELAELKAKPPETKAVDVKVVEPDKPKPVAPDPPTLEGEAGGDWDKFQKLTAEYNKVKYPAYVEELSDWKADQRDIATKKKADDDAAAKRTEAENKVKAEAIEAEEKAKVTWNSQLQAVKDSHPDYDEKTSKVPASQAMAIAIGDLENGPEFCYWLADRPEEAKRIADLTGFGKTLSLPDLRKAVIKAVREFDKLGFESTPTAEVIVEPPAAETVSAAVAPVTIVPPVNPKPASTKAPRPPSPVNDRGNPGPQDPSKADSFEAYEQARRLKTATRR